MSAMRQAEGESASIGAMDAKDPQAPQPLGRPAPSKIPFSAFASLAHEAILILDATQHITFANSAAEALFGYGSGELLGASVDALIPDALRAAHHEWVQRFAAGPAGERAMSGRPEVRARHRSGAEFPAEASIAKLEADGELLLIVILRDLSRRQEGARGGPASILQAERALRLLSEAGARLSALKDDETIAAALADLVVPELADGCRISILDAGGADAKDFDRAWAPEHSDHQSVSLMVARDLTKGTLTAARHQPRVAFSVEDLRLIEELARRAAVALDNAGLHREAQRAVAAWAQVLRMVAHDLRNPLNLINLASSRLQQIMPDLPKDLETIPAVIKHAVHRANRLIGDLQDCAQLAAGKLQVRLTPCAPRRLLDVVVDHYQAILREHELTLEVTASEGLPEVLADRARALQILENLMENAIMFTPEGGKIQLRADEIDGAVRFAVSDSGPGIAKEHLAALLTPFWQGRPTGQPAAALGLSVARGLAEAQGGRLWVESEEGRGATFFLTLKAQAGS